LIAIVKCVLGIHARCLLLGNLEVSVSKLYAYGFKSDIYGKKN